MSRLVPAARRLIEEVRQVLPDAEVEELPEVDGLGFRRSIRFSKETAAELGKTLDLIEDPRIAAIVPSSYGVRVTFVDDTRADWPTPFGAAQAYAVLHEED